MSRNHLIIEHAIDEIVVGHQYRRDLGDLDDLTESIRRLGLLHPVAVTSTYVLISGNRRLAALRRLGHTSAPIWIVPDVSDQLTTVLAIQNENTLQKALTPIEQAELYAELKTIYAEDTARRDAETRFGSPSRIEHIAGLQADSCGGAESALPQRDTTQTSLGRITRARSRAARAVTGRDSRSMLEHVLELQKIAVGDTEDSLVREAAAEALIDLNQDGKVEGRFLRVKLAQHTTTLARLADDRNVPDAVRAAAHAELAALAPEESLKTAVRVAALAAERLSEGWRADLAQTTQVGWSDADPCLRQKHEVRRLVDQLRPEHCWWSSFDPNVIGEHATDEQWDLIRTAAASSKSFVDSAALARQMTAAAEPK
ncbi:hypothetical protein GCM10027052_09330 [Parafrigoribacterium mesophilum]|uniref:ParB/RepB/Spo0J family partition protein n=1 Tax=Parafrigoribacterium mesophilum TaxID=433646 RepID=UPI0031FDECD3